MNVRDIMTDSPMTAELTTTIRVVLRTMQQYGIRHIPIVEAGDVVAVVSDSEMSFLHGILDIYMDSDVSFIDEIMDLPVEHILRARYEKPQELITVFENDAINTAVDLMIENNLSNLPVLKQNSKQLVGVLSYIDILSYSRLNNLFSAT